MRKAFLLAMTLTCGMPVCGTFSAMAAPEPLAVGQAVTTITGTVLDESGEPLIGATVAQKSNPSNGASTDIDGKFSLRVAKGTAIVISYIGYRTVEVPAEEGMQVTLQANDAVLDEVVVVGYGTQRRANLTGAVSTVDVAKVMDSRPATDVAKALQGAVPGLTITTSDGSINGNANLRIRGVGTLSNSQVSNPLIVVDGVPVDDLSFVNPDDIAEISVLKDAASSSIYGTRAAFGVILVTTKAPKAKERVSVKYTNNFSFSQATKLPEYSSVPNQLRALIQSNNRQGVENELFGMYLDKMLPYAEAWEAQNGGPRGYGEMRKFESWDNVGDYYVNEDGTGAMYYANWDVADILFHTAPANKHDVSLEGTSGKTQYRVSFGYNQREGLLRYNAPTMKRYNVTSNISTEIASWWKAGVRFNFADKVYNGPNYWRNPYTYGWRWGSYFGPYGYMKDEEGNIYDCNSAVAYSKVGGSFDDDATDIRMQAYSDFQIFKDLTLHADFTYDLQNYNAHTATLPVTVWNTWGGNISAPSLQRGQSATSAKETNSYAHLWNLNVYGTYAKSLIDNKFNLKVMLGGTAEKYDYAEFSAQRDVLQDNSLPFLGLTSGDNRTTTNSRSRRATAGFFGRINLDWDNIYLLEFNGRYDGSSRFPAGDQWAFFPSVSGGYRISETGYFEPAKEYVSNLKVRASYGHIGNEAIGSNMFLSTIANGSLNYLYNGQKLAYNGMPTLVSSTLTWERIITTDVGFDLGLLNNTINLTFDWFQRDTKDMLAPSQPLPSVLGASAPTGNNGSLRTRGWELGIGWNQNIGEASVYANFNIYDGKTVVTKYRNDTGILTSFYDGKNYGEIWGFETDRYFTEADFQRDAQGNFLKDAKGNFIPVEGVASQVDLQSSTFKYGPGDVKFKDLNGDGVINGGYSNAKLLNGKLILPGDPDYNNPEATSQGAGTLANRGDLKVIGNATPRYEYSFRLGGSLRGFDLDMYFQGVGKRQMWQTSAFIMPLMRGADATYANQESYNKMIFDESNNIIGYEIDQNNDFPCMFPGSVGSGTVPNLGQGRYNFYPQSKYLSNAAYLRFKTLTVGYTLPAELTRKAWIQKARVYFTAENLALLYDGMKNCPIDPEIGSYWRTTTSYSDGTYGRSEPMSRSFSFGIQVTL